MAFTEEEKKERSRTRSRIWAQKKWAEDPEGMRAKRKKYAADNPEKMRDLSLRHYGVTAAQVDAFHANQGGKCAICLSEIPATGKGRHLDHCHRTNVIRGVLCVGCNLGLGNFKDSPEALRRAAHYIETASTGIVVADPERLNRPNAAMARRAEKRARDLGAKG